jgi:hypothetical protein
MPLSFESIAYAIAFLGFGFMAALFLLLWSANVRGSKECEEAARFLESIDKLEDPAEEAARFLRMSREDVELEIQRGRLMNLVGQKVASTAATLKSPIPIFKIRW